MATLADALPTSTSDTVYTQGEWPDLRRKYREQYYWYSGGEWKKEQEGKRDSSGDTALQFPLQVNPIAKVCRIHRAVMLGMQPDIIDRSPISTIVNKATLTPADRENAQVLEQTIARIWYDSNGPSIQQEACLLMQYYGGHVYHMTWEPWNKNLKWRVGIRSYATPEVFFPVQFDPTTYEILECYIGYMIDADFARSYYHVKVPDGTKQTLYLEHWDRENYTITVHGIVPSIKDEDRNGLRHEYQGENKWGVVPIVYNPHERDGRFWGRSLVDDDSPLIGLSREWNARLADKGDVMQESSPLIWASNARNANWSVVPVRINEKLTINILDMGSSQPVSPQAEPKLGIINPQGLPTSVANYVDELQDEVRSQADVAAVAYGDDDVSGGRITGPVTAYRMWPTMQHTMSERAFAHVALTRIAKIVVKIVLERKKSNKYKEWSTTAPEIDDWAHDMSFATQWRPMIPIEQSQMIDTLNARLKEGGISLISYLEQLSVQDPEKEADRIWEDRERLAKIEAEAKAEAMANMGGMFGNNGGSDGLSS